MYIHYVWIDFKNESNPTPVIPELYLQRLDLCKRVNSDAEIILWTGSTCRNFLETNYPSYLPLYDSLDEPIMRCDMVRYFILYHYGGVYLDLDRISVKPLSALLEKYREYDVLLGQTLDPVGGMLNNDFMACQEPGSDFMRTCMENIKKVDYLIRELTVHKTAGPLFLTSMYRNYKGDEKIIVLSKEVANCNSCECSPNFDECYTFADLSSSDWHVGPEAIKRFFYCNRRTLFWVLALTVVVWYFLKRCGKCLK